MEENFLDNRIKKYYEKKIELIFKNFNYTANNILIFEELANNIHLSAIKNSEENKNINRELAYRFILKTVKKINDKNNPTLKKEKDFFLDFFKKMGENNE